MEESLEDDDCSLMAKEIALHVVVRYTILNLASSSIMTISNKDLQNELKNIMETLAHLKINVVLSWEKIKQNVERGSKGYKYYPSRQNSPLGNFALSYFSCGDFFFQQICHNP